MSREQKTAMGVFSVLGIATLILSAIVIQRALVYPFTAPVNQLSVIKKMFGPTDVEKENQQKRTDTDGDGISDWDELNVYRTSSYLSDTDGDSIADNLEIAQRTDPNCPQGQTCYQASLSSTSSADLANNLPTISSGANMLPLKPERSAASIRQYLRASGMAESEISGFTDQMLLDAYDQSSNSFQTPAASPSTEAAATSSAAGAFLQGLGATNTQGY
jgi:hypothetical protein